MARGGRETVEAATHSIRGVVARRMGDATVVIGDETGVRGGRDGRGHDFMGVWLKS